MNGNFSEEAMEAFAAMVGEENFSEGLFDFTRCQRADGSFYGTSGRCRKGTDAGAKEQAAPSAPRGGGRGSRGPIDHDARVARHEAAYEAAKKAHAESKAALAAHRGRDARSRALKQPLAHAHYVNTEKLDAAWGKVIKAKIARKKAEDAASEGEGEGTKKATGVAETPKPQPKETENKKAQQLPPQTHEDLNKVREKVKEKIEAKKGTEEPETKPSVQSEPKKMVSENKPEKQSAEGPKEKNGDEKARQERMAQAKERFIQKYNNIESKIDELTGRKKPYNPNAPAYDRKEEDRLINQSREAARKARVLGEYAKAVDKPGYLKAVKEQFAAEKEISSLKAKRMGVGLTPETRKAIEPLLNEAIKRSTNADKKIQDAISGVTPEMRRKTDPTYKALLKTTETSKEQNAAHKGSTNVLNNDEALNTKSKEGKEFLEKFGGDAKKANEAITAIIDFTRNDYRSIRAAALGQEDNSKRATQAKLINQALSALPHPDVQKFRGVNISQSQLDDLIKHANNKETFEDKAPSSWSTSADISHSYTGEHTGDRRRVMFVTRNRHGASVEKWGQEGEKELLTPGETSYRYTGYKSVMHEGNPVHIFEVEEL